MAVQRATMIFKASTTSLLRSAGWSESWYKEGAQEATLTALKDLCAVRANCLAGTAQIAGQRVQQLGGRSISDGLIFPGRQRLTVDIPQMAITANVSNAGSLQKKTFSMRGIPDDAIIGGDFTGAGGLLQAVNGFFAGLANGAWQWQARDTSLGTVQLQSVGVDGTFVLAGDYIFNQGDYLTMVRVKDINGHSIVGNFLVGTKTDARNGKFFAWPNRVVQLSGKVRKLNFIYPVVAFNSGKIVRSMIRKVGRPLDLYRGRATVRR